MTKTSNKHEYQITHIMLTDSKHSKDLLCCHQSPIRTDFNSYCSASNNTPLWHSLHSPSEDAVSQVTAFLSTKNNSLSVFSATIPLHHTLT